MHHDTPQHELCVCVCVWAFFLSLSFSCARSLCGQSVKQCAYLHMCKSFILLVINQLLNEVKKNKVNVIFQINLLCERRKKEKIRSEKETKNERKKGIYIHDGLAHTVGVKQRDIPFNFPSFIAFPFSFNIRLFHLLHSTKSNATLSVYLFFQWK